ncbi:MAG: SAM-dependent methyltransferase, partial [Patescibacteria group bacterium]
VGTIQLHPKLVGNKRIELHEKTDIRNFIAKKSPDIILIDVSFISLRQILPHLAQIVGKNTQVLAMVKPQFEAGKDQINRGVVKNDRIRRQILKDFENWIKNLFKILDKTDSEVPGNKGNLERFYLIQKIN